MRKINSSANICEIFNCGQNRCSTPINKKIQSKLMYHDLNSINNYGAKIVRKVSVSNLRKNISPKATNNIENSNYRRNFRKNLKYCNFVQLPEYFNTLPGDYTNRNSKNKDYNEKMPKQVNLFKNYKKLIKKPEEEKNNFENSIIGNNLTKFNIGVNPIKIKNLLNNVKIDIPKILERQKNCIRKKLNDTFYYMGNKNFLLKFKIKDNTILIECLNTKYISTNREMFSNCFRINDIFEKLETKENVDIKSYLQKLLNKKSPTVIFDDEQNEIKLKIFEDDKVFQLVLVKKTCNDDEFIKKNKEKKIRQYIEEKKNIFKKFLQENKDLDNEINFEELQINEYAKNKISNFNGLMKAGLKEIEQI